MSPLSFRFFICKIRRLDLMFSKASSISKILRSIIFREYWSYHHNSFYKKNCKSVYKTDDSSRNSKARYLQMLPLTVISLVTVCWNILWQAPLSNSRVQREITSWIMQSYDSRHAAFTWDFWKWTQAPFLLPHHLEDIHTVFAHSVFHSYEVAKVGNN